MKPYARSSRWVQEGNGWVKVREGSSWRTVPFVEIDDPYRDNIFGKVQEMFRLEAEWEDSCKWRAVYDQWAEDRRFFRRTTGHSPPVKLLVRMGKTKEMRERASEYLQSFAAFMVWFKRAVLPWEKAGRKGTLFDFLRWVSLQQLEQQLETFGITPKGGSCGVK